MSFPGKQLQRCWHLIDAQNQTVGRLAVQVSSLLRGKHKPTYLPNKDMGDTVVVINASKVTFTEPQKKWKDKVYRWHTGYPGGLKERTAAEMMHRKPTEVLRKAVMGMLKRNRLRHGFLEPRLKIYPGSEHPHTAQLPAEVEPVSPVPRNLNRHFHYGLQHYAHPASYQEGIPGPIGKAQVEHVELVEDMFPTEAHQAQK